jgi:hypothetical protein
MFHAFELETGNCRVAQPGNSFDFADLQFAKSRFRALEVPKFFSISALQFAASGFPLDEIYVHHSRTSHTARGTASGFSMQIQIQFVGRAEVNI